MQPAFLCGLQHMHTTISTSQFTDRLPILSSASASKKYHLSDKIQVQF